jgi:anion-transporting  ArsA/GET3 family ATPase
MAFLGLSDKPEKPYKQSEKQFIGRKTMADLRFTEITVVGCELFQDTETFLNSLSDLSIIYSADTSYKNQISEYDD